MSESYLSEQATGVLSVSPLFTGESSSSSQKVSKPNPVQTANTGGDGTSGLAGASFNFINSIVGAGIIGMPVAILESGLFMGIFLIIFVGILINSSTIMIIECGVACKKLNLEELCRHLFGKYGYNVCALSMFFYAFGAMMAYMIIIGDNVPAVLRYFGASLGRTPVMLIAACCIILPISLLRDMSTLSWTSLISISADVLMVTFICSRANIAAENQNTQFEAPKDVTFINPAQFAAGIGTISFAFVCQHSSFIVFRSMKEGTLANWTKVANYSLFIAGILCLLLGLVSYLAFGSHTNADVLTNFGENDKLILVARLLLAITMLFTYPMEMFVARHALISMAHSFFGKDKKDYDPESGSLSSSPSLMNQDRTNSNSLFSSPSMAGAINMTDLIQGSDGGNCSSSSSSSTTSGLNAGHTSEGGGEEEHSVSLVEHAGVTITLWGIILALSIASANLGVVLALTGSLAASMLGFIIPASLYLKTYESEFLIFIHSFNKDSPTYQPLSFEHLRSGSRFIWAVFMLVFGIVAMFTGVGTVFYGLAN